MIFELLVATERRVEVAKPLLNRETTTDWSEGMGSAGDGEEDGEQNGQEDEVCQLTFLLAAYSLFNGVKGHRMPVKRKR
jgi:hypothetical protein